jgi:hypothetical protein
MSTQRGTLNYDLVGLVSVAVVARESNIVLVAASAFRQGYHVVELYLIVLQVLATMLACIVVAPNNPHLSPKRNVPARSTLFSGFGRSLGRKHDRAHVAEKRALHLGNRWRDALRIVFRIEGPDALLKSPPFSWVNPSPIGKATHFQTFFQVLVMPNSLLADGWQERRLFNQRAVRAVSELPAGLANPACERSPVLKNFLVWLALAITKQALDFRVQRRGLLFAHGTPSRAIHPSW